MASLVFHLSKRIRPAICKKIKMTILAIMFAAVVIGVQCRSVTFANTRDAEKENAACVEMHRSVRVHRDANQDAPSSIRTESVVSSDSSDSTGEKTLLNTTEQLKDLIKLYEKNFANPVEYVKKTNKNKDDHQREIRFLEKLRSLIEQLVEEQSKAPSKEPTITSVENLKDLLDTVKELNIVYQDGEITDHEHIRIKRAAEEYKGTFMMSDKKQINNLLVDVRQNLKQLHKYLEILCKKHHAKSSISSVESLDIDDASSVDHQPNKVSIIQNEQARE